MNKSLKFLLPAVLLAVPAVLSAQNIKYITYFPTPHSYFSNLEVASAIIAARGERVVRSTNTSDPDVYDIGQGKVIVGSVQNTSGELFIEDSFAAQDMTLWLANTTPAVSNTDLIVGSMSGYPADFSNGIFSTLGNLTLTGTSVNTTTAQFTGLRAHNYITLKDIGWGADKNIVGTTSWPSCSNVYLKWKQLKIQGTNVMRFYLVGCCNSSC
jgi:hypothetical protein